MPSRTIERSAKRSGLTAAAATSGATPSASTAAISAARPVWRGGAIRVRSAHRWPQRGTSTGSDAAIRTSTGKTGIRKRKNDPLSTLEESAEPLITKNAQNQSDRKAAMGIDRLATAMAPAMGSHWSTRRLKKTSARPRRFRCRWCQSMST